jgi:large subunit ribosomal protein L10
VNRTEKAEAVQKMSEAFAQAPHVFVTGYRGMTVNQSSELRRRVRAAGGTYQVIKNRLARRAATDNAVGKVEASLRGPCALVSHGTDAIVLAKVLSDFAKDNPQLELITAVVDGKDVVAGPGIKTLATLPALPELRAQLLNLVQTPATMLARLLQTPGGQVARALDARREKLSGAETPETPAEG